MLYVKYYGTIIGKFISAATAAKFVTAMSDECGWDFKGFSVEED